MVVVLYFKILRTKPPEKIYRYVNLNKIEMERSKIRKWSVQDSNCCFTYSKKRLQFDFSWIAAAFLFLLRHLLICLPHRQRVSFTAPKTKSAVQMSSQTTIVYYFIFDNDFFTYPPKTAVFISSQITNVFYFYLDKTAFLFVSRQRQFISFPQITTIFNLSPKNNCFFTDNSCFITSP